MLVGARDLLPVLLHAGYEVVFFDSVFEAAELPSRYVDAAIVEAELAMTLGFALALEIRDPGAPVAPLLVFRRATQVGMLGTDLGVVRASDGSVRSEELLDRLALAITMTETVRNLERSRSILDVPELGIQDARTVENTPTVIGKARNRRSSNE